MRSAVTLALSLVIASVVVSPAAAQRGGFGRGAGALMMLRSQEVQDELDLSEGQVSELTQFMLDVMTEFQNLGGFTEEEREEIVQEIMADAQTMVDETLDEKQKTRFNQLSLQREGIAAVVKDEVAEKLELNEDQVAKIHKQMEVLEKKQQELREEAQEGGDRQTVFAEFRSLREQTESDILAVLSDQQKESWQAMLGEPFEFPRRGGGFGGGRGGRGGGRDRGNRE